MKKMQFLRCVAALPIVMSLTALTMVLAHAMLVGRDVRPDEGALAHLFQLLMMAQLPLLGVCAVMFLRRHSAQFALVFVAQGGLWIAALCAAYVFV